MKIKIKYVDSRKLKDYAGANWYFAKKVGMPYPYPKNVILVDKKLDTITRRRTILHETEELKRMRQGEDYWSSHVASLKIEKQIK